MILRKTYWILAFSLLAGCVDPIAFDVESIKSQLVVDGSITNEPGPYVVSLFRTRQLKTDLDYRLPEVRAVVKIFSDAGEEETLIENPSGTYSTSTIQGVVGRTYFIRIVTENGSTYESQPETIKPAGSIDALWAEYEERRKPVGSLEVNDDRLNIYLNASTVPGQENYIRWRVVGTYKIETHPYLKTKYDNNFNPPIIVPDPPECSGYENRNNTLVEVADCECCICWVTNYEVLPQVSDEQFNEGNQFKRRFVGMVPAQVEYFIQGYHAAVAQISLSRTAYNYFRMIRSQKEGAASLFQPVSGKLRGNIVRTNGDEEVQGLFWAGGVVNSSVYVDRYDLPNFLGTPPIKIVECDVLKNSSATKPSFWIFK